MKFGTEGQFEIECYRDYEPDEKNRVFGRMCLLVGGNALGNIEEFSCMLNVTGYQLEGALEKLGSLSNSELEGLKDSAAFELLDNAIYLGGERTDKEVHEDTLQYGIHDFLTNGGESFDGTKSFFFVSGENVKVLFTDHEERFHSASVPATTFKSAISGFLGWLKRGGGSEG